VSKFVIDADGLIKVGKSGLLGALVGSHEVLVPEAVYEEAVVRGKRELYEDAFELERLLEDEGVSIARSDPEPQADRLLEGVTSLGAGETGALRLYFAEGADAVSSDDRVFLNFLSRHSVPFVTPVNVVVGLARSGRVSLREGLEALEKLSGFVRADVYERAKAELGDPRKESEGDNG
jgi:predicted nucleic acid-binding protein